MLRPHISIVVAVSRALVEEYPSIFASGAAICRAMSARANSPLGVAGPRISSTVMLCMVLAYATFALFATGALGQGVNRHAVAEVLHLPGQVRAAAEQRPGMGVAPLANRTQAESKSIQIAPPDWDSTQVAPRDSSQQLAVLASWLGSLLLGWDEIRASSEPVWVSAYDPGVILSRWHRAVVLHL